VELEEVEQVPTDVGVGVSVDPEAGLGFKERRDLAEVGAHPDPLWGRDAEGDGHGEGDARITGGLFHVQSPPDRW
jgi:hypothetical protein